MEEQKRGPGRPRKEQVMDEAPKAQTVACEVLRDFWPTDNQEDRVRAGTIVDLEPMDALDKVEAGLVRRVR